MIRPKNLFSITFLSLVISINLYSCKPAGSEGDLKQAKALGSKHIADNLSPEILDKLYISRLDPAAILYAMLLYLDQHDAYYQSEFLRNGNGVFRKSGNTSIIQDFVNEWSIPNPQNLYSTPSTSSPDKKKKKFFGRSKSKSKSKSLSQEINLRDFMESFGQLDYITQSYFIKSYFSLIWPSVRGYEEFYKDMLDQIQGIRERNSSGSSNEMWSSVAGFLSLLNRPIALTTKDGFQIKESPMLGDIYAEVLDIAADLHKHHKGRDSSLGPASCTNMGVVLAPNLFAWESVEDTMKHALTDPVVIQAICEFGVNLKAKDPTFDFSRLLTTSSAPGRLEGNSTTSTPSVSWKSSNPRRKPKYDTLNREPVVIKGKPMPKFAPPTPPRRQVSIVEVARTVPPSKPLPPTPRKRNGLYGPGSVKQGINFLESNLFMRPPTP